MHRTCRQANEIELPATHECTNTRRFLTRYNPGRIATETGRSENGNMNPQWVIALISPTHLHVLRAHMGRHGGCVNEIELTATQTSLNGSSQVGL